MAEFIDFNPKIIELNLAELNLDTPSLWGTMTAQHMVEHLIIVVKLSRGRFKVEVVTPEDKVEKVKRIMLLSDLPLKRDFRAPFLPPGLQPYKYESLEKAKTELLAEINAYIDYWNTNENSIFNHPIFGPLNSNEWQIFHGKHFTHHFSQFGLI